MKLLTNRSGGEFIPHQDDAPDGADAVGWLMAQSWCDGNVGSYGPSYLGFAQWATAAQAPDGLKAIAPTVATTDFT